MTEKRIFQKIQKVFGQKSLDSSCAAFTHEELRTNVALKFERLKTQIKLYIHLYTSLISNHIILHSKVLCTQQLCNRINGKKKTLRMDTCDSQFIQHYHIFK